VPRAIEHPVHGVCGERVSAASVAVSPACYARTGVLVLARGRPCISWLKPRGFLARFCKRTCTTSNCGVCAAPLTCVTPSVYLCLIVSLACITAQTPSDDSTSRAGKSQGVKPCLPIRRPRPLPRIPFPARVRVVSACSACSLTPMTPRSDSGSAVPLRVHAPSEPVCLSLPGSSFDSGGVE
jgi:hypothetical protein